LADEKSDSINEYEKVFCVNDSWDGRPIEGVALFMQKPHYFHCMFDEKTDDWSDYYNLTSISQEVLDKVVENWNFWLHWNNDNIRIYHPVIYKKLRASQSKEHIIREFDKSISEDEWDKAEKCYNNRIDIELYLIIGEDSIKVKGTFKRIRDGSWGYEERAPKLVKWECV